MTETGGPPRYLPGKSVGLHPYWHASTVRTAELPTDAGLSLAAWFKESMIALDAGVGRECKRELQKWVVIRCNRNIQ